MAVYYEPQLIDGWKFDEVTSALQKCIRRGLEYEACFFAYIIHQSNFGAYLWRRLSIICSEDIGNGNPNAVLILNSLKDNWMDFHKYSKEVSLGKFLFVVHAVLCLCRSEKSREDDNISNFIEENYKAGNRLEIPEFAKDFHTKDGRKVWGRLGDLNDNLEATRLRLWKKEWSKLNKLAYPDKWEDKILGIWMEKTKKKE